MTQPLTHTNLKADNIVIGKGEENIKLSFWAIHF